LRVRLRRRRVLHRRPNRRHRQRPRNARPTIRSVERYLGSDSIRTEMAPRGKGCGLTDLRRARRGPLARFRTTGLGRVVTAGSLRGGEGKVRLQRR
jgi:hypothetical protein